MTIALIISSCGPGLVAKASPVRRVDYAFSFDENGSTLTRIVIEDNQSSSGALWVLVPKGPNKWSLRVLEGKLERQTIADAQTSSGPMVFYDNLTLYYAGPLMALINWTMDYGALLLEPRGLFVSPAIMTSGDISGYVRLNLTKGVERVNYATPRYTEITPGVLQFDLKEVMQNPEGAGRIYVFFLLSGQGSAEEFTEGSYTISTASRYKDLAKRVLTTYNRATPVLQRLFNVTLGHTYVEFFVPQSADEMPIGGFVPVLPDRFSVGNISLNLFYFRTQEGYIESIALHELVHQCCARAGIPPSLLWVHEGLANYVGIEMTYFLGLPGARDIEESLMFEAARIPRSQYHIVEDWTPSYANPSYSIFQHYAIAYEMIRELGAEFREDGEPFSGYDYYADVFQTIVGGGQRPNSTLQLLSAMELASPNGSEVDSMFLAWEFRVPDISKLYERIQSLREKLRDSPPLISFFVPSMLAKLAEAERLLKGDNILLAQELVSEVEAFVGRMWMVMGALLLMGAVLAMSFILSRRMRRTVEEAIGVGP